MISTVCTEEIDKDIICGSDTINIYKRPFKDNDNSHIFSIRKCIDECELSKSKEGKHNNKICLYCGQMGEVQTTNWAKADEISLGL